MAKESVWLVDRKWCREVHVCKTNGSLLADRENSLIEDLYDLVIKRSATPSQIFNSIHTISKRRIHACKNNLEFINGYCAGCTDVFKYNGLKLPLPLKKLI